MNKLEMRTAIDNAMQNDNIVDAREMNGIVAQAMVNDISPFEINAARALLRDGNAEVAVDRAAVRNINARIKTSIKDLNAPEGVAALQQKVAAEAALTIATNRRDAYKTLADTLYANADEGVQRTADQFQVFGRDLDHTGHVIVNGTKDVGDRIGDAVSDAGNAAGRIFRDLFGHRN